LPQELVTSVDIFRKYHGHDLDITVHFNVFGEVLSFENDYFDLPEVAKKMTYGGNPPSEIKSLEIFSQELRIILPLMALGFHRKALMPHWLIPLQDALGKLKTKAKDGNVYIPDEYIEDKWTQTLYEAKDTENYHMFFKFFIADEKPPQGKMSDLFTNAMEFKNRTLRDDLKTGKEYANMYFVFSLLQLAEPDSLKRITEQIDVTTSDMMIDISAILNKEIFMEKRLERDVIHKVLDFINVDNIKNSFIDSYSKNFKDKFNVTDPVLKGMLNTYIFKVKGGASFQKSKSTMNDVFRDFYNIFKPY